MTQEETLTRSAAQLARAQRVRILIVGAEPGLRGAVERWAADASAETGTAPDLPRAARRLAEERWDVVLAVLGDEPEIALSWWEEALRDVAGRPHVLLATDHPSMSLALSATKLGALDLIPLPPARADLLRALERTRSAWTDGAVALPRVQGHSVGQHALVGESPAMLGVYKQIATIAPSTATVLIHGESGTGKELVARAIHANGPTHRGRFVAVNCAAIPENLLESELFGHEKGAFTGAVARKVGRFQQAQGGTILLDEIGDMSLALQAKILRAIQEREIEPLGATETVAIDVRVVAATNQDLRAAIGQCRFREDLFYRLAVVTIALPALRARGRDLDLLTAHFVHLFADRHGKRVTGVANGTLALLRGHAWRGNVRELGNVIERAVIVSTGGILRAEDLPEELHRTSADASSRPFATLAEVEARHIAVVLQHTRGSICEAAHILGIHRNTLARRIREAGL